MRLHLLGQEAEEEVMWEEGAPYQLQEQSLTTAAEETRNRVPTSPEILIATIVAPWIGIGHINVQTSTQNNKRSFI